jgi:hypothetical protein
VVTLVILKKPGTRRMISVRLPTGNSDPGEPRSFLLVGDGSLAPDGKIEVPVMENDAVFTGDFVMTVHRAWDAVRDFVRTGSVGGIGQPAVIT